MSVTAQQSTQITNRSATPDVKNKVIDNAEVRFARFDFTQVGAGDATSTVDLVKFGSGLHRIIPALSRIKASAFGSGRTIDVGLTAYTKPDGTSASAQTDVIADGLDVSSGAGALLGTGTNGLPDGIEFESKTGVIVQAVVAGGTIPDGATLSGWIAYVRNK